MESENKDQEGSVKKSPFDDLSRDELIAKCKGLLVIAQKAKQAKSDIQNECDHLKSQLKNCETAKNTSDNNVKTLQELVDSLTEQKLSYITEIDAAKSKIKSLDGKCNALLDEIQKHKTELTTKDKSLVVATQKLSDLDSEIISLKRQNNRLLEENEQLINQLTELENRTTEFNNIGLQQREQLQILEEKVQTDTVFESKIEELNKRIQELESTNESEKAKNIELTNTYDSKVDEVIKLYESEKLKKEKANIKLRSYKDKILKCAACINQLKGSRYILSKTVKEYSENIPKWQNEIIKASKVLDTQINELNNENISLKEKLQILEKQLSDSLSSQNTTHDESIISQVNQLNDENSRLKSQIVELEEQLNGLQNLSASLKTELVEINSKCDILKETNTTLKNENNLLNDNLKEVNIQITTLSAKNNELLHNVEDLNNRNKHLNESLLAKEESNMADEKLMLQIKALESEKAILVKEKLTGKDTIIELENQNRALRDEADTIKSELQKVKQKSEAILHEKCEIIEEYKKEKEKDSEKVKHEITILQEQLDKAKKDYDDLLDLNGLLKEEIDTLKLSLEQPKDDSENYSEINESLQADIVRLETKLSAYKQENALLLAEIKESRVKSKEFDSLVSEYEDAKSKLASYKTENAELLNEMKEINQVLKERGEAIFKLQKAVAELERLMETLEKDRDSVKNERDGLLQKIELLEEDLRKVENKIIENNKATEDIITERDNVLKCVAEKDAIITSLKEDIEKLKQQNSIVDLPNDDMSTSTISKAEEHARMKDLDETFEDKYTKLRIFALKLKKKLNETTSQLQISEQEKTKLKKMINDKVASSDNADSHPKEDAHIKKSEISDLEAKVKTLTDNLEVSTKVSANLEKVEAELRVTSQQLNAEIEAHKSTKEQLEKALRDVKKKNVLSLEMEDYERSMKDLTIKMDESKKKIVQMESTIDTQEGTITAMKTQIKLLEDQIKTEETQNRLIKEELQHAIEDSKEKDNVINSKKDLIVKLMQDLEDEKRKNEECDLETTALISEKEKIIMNLGEEKIELNNKIKRLEFKCAGADEKLRVANIELADLKTEYTSYKVRAQAVLRQNQTVDHSQEEQLKEEAAALKAQIETVTAKNTSLQDQCNELSAELEAARKRAAEAGGEAARAGQRTARLHADLARLSHQLDAERAQHKLQITTLTQCYKSQISDLETKLQKETESFTKQIVSLQEAAKLSKPLPEDNRDKYMLPVIAKEDGSDGEMDINVSLIPREEGEGSESAPSPPLSKAFLTSGSSRRSPVPLERLLEEGVPEDDALDTASLSFTPEQEISDLRRKLQAQQQRVKHVTVLLAESERECARMAQLSELLKAELRRVRGDASAAHNTEYMKNVTLKFLTLPPGDERGRLVPVLQKILTLSPDETQKMHAIAKGLDPNRNKSWGSYLPWPGGK
ncbi:uncharacterized protein [Epargyreus clarus]|uniref:uncharacterized protein n=1 Tax=Epargyreus clarus TaxID=520877 RepID=UPI003C2FD0C5